MILDLFAGPGGWDYAAQQLGLTVRGVEYDPHACATREAVGLATDQADVATYPAPTTDGLIASPPCQAFSLAGKGDGRRDVGRLHDFITAWGRDGWHDPGDDWADPRTPLVLQPLRFIEQSQPTWVALEQVPPVLELWEHIAAVLHDDGWHQWTGVLNAADYGVPQTRRRAFLLAHRDRHVTAPFPTHSEHPEPTLFGDGLEPWVTMADALGWGTRLDLTSEQVWVHERPSTTIVGSFDPEVVAAPGYRQAGDPPRQDTPGSVRITLADALTLQSFPADYPVAGPKTAQFLQVGNAVPPLLARRVLEEVTR